MEKPFAYAVTSFLFILVVYALRDSKDNLQRLNPKKPFELMTRSLLEEYLAKGWEMLIRGRETYGQDPYRLYSDFGDVVVLPAELMPEREWSICPSSARWLAAFHGPWPIACYTGA